jgi:hypothetical protein
VTHSQIEIKKHCEQFIIKKFIKRYQNKKEGFLKKIKEAEV